MARTMIPARRAIAVAIMYPGMSAPPSLAWTFAMSFETWSDMTSIREHPGSANCTTDEAVRGRTNRRQVQS